MTGRAGNSSSSRGLGLQFQTGEEILDWAQRHGDKSVHQTSIEQMLTQFPAVQWVNTQLREAILISLCGVGSEALEIVKNVLTNIAQFFIQQDVLGFSVMQEGRSSS